MQFFKYKGLTSCEAWAQENDNRRVMREKTAKISLKSDAFNQKLQWEAFFFVVDASGDIVTIGVISRDSRYLQKQLAEYLKEDLNVQGVTKDAWYRITVVKNE